MRAVEGIVADADFASDYASLRRDMVYGVAADFETAIRDTENVGQHPKRAASMTPSKRNVVVGTRLLAIQRPIQRFIVF